MQIWPFIPQTVFTEVWEWKTDVIKCKASEQRIALRNLPRTGYSFNFLLTPQEVSLARYIISQVSSDNLLIPFWGSIGRLASLPIGTGEIELDTANAGYSVGGKLILFNHNQDYEVVQIAGVGSEAVALSTPTTKGFGDCLVMPIVVARFAAATKFKVDNFELTGCRVEVSATKAPPFTTQPVESYLGHPVLLSRPVLLAALDETLTQEVLLTDSLLGLVDAHVKYNHLTYESRMFWSTLTKTEFDEVKNFIWLCKGRQKAFWRPTWTTDIELAEGIAEDAVEVVISSINWQVRHTSARHLMFVLTTGQRIYVEVESGTTVGAEDILTLAEPFPQSVAVLDIEFICFLELSRLDADRFEIKHLAGGHKTIAAPLVGIQNEL